MADADYESTVLQDIIEAQRSEDDCERAYVVAKEELKELKDAWDKAKDHRVELVRHADQRRLPLDDVA